MKTGFSVRLDDEERKQLEEISVATGLPCSELIRAAIQGLVRHYKANNGRLILPLYIDEK